MSQNSKVEEIRVKAFQDQCGNGRYTLRCRLLHHLTEDLERFSSTDLLDASPYERYNVHIKQVYFHTSQRLSSSMGEMVEVMNQDVKESVTASSVQMEIEDNRQSSVQDKL